MVSGPTARTEGRTMSTRSPNEADTHGGTKRGVKQRGGTATALTGVNERLNAE